MPTRRQTGLATAVVLAGTLAVVGVTASDGEPGELTVVTDPPAPVTVVVDGVERSAEGRVNRIPVGPGPVEVCALPTAQWLTGGCHTANVPSGGTTTVTVTTVEAGTLHIDGTAAGQVGVNGIARDVPPVTIPVAPGVHEVCGEPVDGLRTPDCEQVRVRVREQTDVTLAWTEEDAMLPDEERPFEELPDTPTEPTGPDTPPWSEPEPPAPIFPDPQPQPDPQPEPEPASQPTPAALYAIMLGAVLAVVGGWWARRTGRLLAWFDRIRDG